jgi:hypothetical protein
MPPLNLLFGLKIFDLNYPTQTHSFLIPGTDDGATSDSGSSLCDGDDYQGAVAGKVSKDNHSQSSLDLSDHETQREYD